jgi:hypothetical protein
MLSKESIGLTGDVVPLFDFTPPGGENEEGHAKHGGL